MLKNDLRHKVLNIYVYTKVLVIFLRGGLFVEAVMEQPDLILTVEAIML